MSRQAKSTAFMSVQSISSRMRAMRRLLSKPLVFTGGIGEYSVEIRSRILKELACLGIYPDAEKNNACFGKKDVISTADSKWKAIVMPTDEELMIARNTLALVK